MIKCVYSRNWQNASVGASDAPESQLLVADQLLSGGASIAATTARAARGRGPRNHGDRRCKLGRGTIAVVPARFGHCLRPRMSAELSVLLPPLHPWLGSRPTATSAEEESAPAAATEAAEESEAAADMAA